MVAVEFDSLDEFGGDLIFSSKAGDGKIQPPTLRETARMRGGMLDLFPLGVRFSNLFLRYTRPPHRCSRRERSPDDRFSARFPKQLSPARGLHLLGKLGGTGIGNVLELIGNMGLQTHRKGLRQIDSSQLPKLDRPEQTSLQRCSDFYVD
ncbi:MAG: hypothetical protein ACLRSD_06465 [Oscillibacter sp.]